MLPARMNVNRRMQVFLSATLSNASEFAAWVAHLHSQPCHVVYTDYRPTPLQHYAYALGSSGLHLVLDERGNFRWVTHKYVCGAQV